MLLDDSFKSDMKSLLNEKAKVSEESKAITEKSKTFESEENEIISVINLSQKKCKHRRTQSLVVLIHKIFICEDGTCEVVWNIIKKAPIFDYENRCLILKYLPVILFLFNFISCGVPLAMIYAIFHRLPSHIYNIIGIANYVKFVFNDNYGCTVIQKCLKNFEQYLYI